MDYKKTIKLVLNHPANDICKGSRDLLETMMIHLDAELKEQNNLLAAFKEYTSLGYDCYLTDLHGKDAIKMVKRYSHKTKGSIECVQVFGHDFETEERLRHALNFMYKDIQEQEENHQFLKDISDD